MEIKTGEKQYKETVSTCCEDRVIFNNIGSYPIKRKRGVDDSSTKTPLYLVSHNIPLSKYWIMSKPRKWAVCCECGKECKTKIITLIKK